MKKMAERGFTLIELMIVVAIIGILAAVALPMLWEAAGKAKKVEAQIQLDKIKKRAIEEYTSHGSFPAVKAAKTPGVDCCKQDIDKKKKCEAKADDWNTPEWRTLEFSLNENFLFQYAYSAPDDGSEFDATAIGDMDCDGNTITYTLEGRRNNGTPKVTLKETDIDD